MVEENGTGGPPLRSVPVDWEALEDAFENNAPEVHSYLHLQTGEVLRIVDGVADPQMHARVTRTMASLGCSISGIGFSITRTRYGPR